VVPRPLGTPYPTAQPNPLTTILITDYPNRNCQQHAYDHHVALKLFTQTNGQCVNYTTPRGTTLYYQLSLNSDGSIAGLNYTCLHPQCMDCEFRFPGWHYTTTPSFNKCYIAANPDMEFSIIIQSVKNDPCIGIAGTTKSGGLMAIHYRTSQYCKPLLAVETTFHDWGEWIYNGACQQVKFTRVDDLLPQLPLFYPGFRDHRDVISSNYCCSSRRFEHYGSMCKAGLGSGVVHRVNVFSTLHFDHLPLFLSIPLLFNPVLLPKNTSDCNNCNITFNNYDMALEPCMSGPPVNGTTSENKWQFRFMNQSQTCADAVTPSPSPSNTVTKTNAGSVVGALIGGVAIGVVAIFGYQYYVARSRKANYSSV